MAVDDIHGDPERCDEERGPRHDGLVNLDVGNHASDGDRHTRTTPPPEPTTMEQGLARMSLERSSASRPSRKSGVSYDRYANMVYASTSHLLYSILNSLPTSMSSLDRSAPPTASEASLDPQPSGHDKKRKRSPSPQVSPQTYQAIERMSLSWQMRESGQDRRVILIPRVSEEISERDLRMWLNSSADHHRSVGVTIQSRCSDLRVLQPSEMHMDSHVGVEPTPGAGRILFGCLRGPRPRNFQRNSTRKTLGILGTIRAAHRSWA